MELLLGVLFGGLLLWHGLRVDALQARVEALQHRLGRFDEIADELGTIIERINERERNGLGSTS